MRKRSRLHALGATRSPETVAQQNDGGWTAKVAKELGEQRTPSRPDL
jgi:hypothetical protein